MQEAPANRAQRSRKKRKLTTRKRYQQSNPAEIRIGPPQPFLPLAFPTHMLSFAPQNVPIGFPREERKQLNQHTPPANQKGDIAQLPTLTPPLSHPPWPRPGHAQVAETTGLEGGVVEGEGEGRGGKGNMQGGGDQNAITQGREMSSGRGSH